MKSDSRTSPSAFISSIPVVVLMGLMLLNVQLGDSYVPTETVIIISTVVAALIACFYLKIPFQKLETGILASIGMAMPAILIIFIVGALIAVWIMSGIVPMLIYYGLMIINPVGFLAVSCIMCAVVSLCTGSSWSTIGTIGLALIAIGTALGIPGGMTAGAIISGAYFGDKMSPMSDTTNLAPAMVGTDVVTHIKHMTYTSGPAILIALVFFALLGLFYQGDDINVSQVAEVQRVIHEHFNVSLWLLLVPIFVVVSVARGLPALPALIFGVVLGVVAVPLFQWQLLERALGEGVTLSTIYASIFNAISSGFNIETGNAMIDKLFNRGGMSSMLGVNFVAIAAMCFGGVLEASGMLQSLTRTILKGVSGVGSLIASTLATALFVNIAAANQTMAIVIPARMFAKTYQRMGLHPKNLSRACEDAGTVTAPLVPWNTNGIYCSAVLGVATLSYLPFAVFCLASPLVSAFLGYADKGISRIDVVDQADDEVPAVITG